jgi:hypothetical protein
MSVGSINEAIQSGMMSTYAAHMAANAAGEKIDNAGFSAMEDQRSQTGALAAGLHEQIKALQDGLGSLAAQLQAGADRGVQEDQIISKSARDIGMGRKHIYEARQDLQPHLGEPNTEEILQQPTVKLEAATAALVARGDMAVYFTRGFRQAGKEAEAIRADLNTLVERIAALASGVTVIGEVPAEQATELHNLHQAAPTAIKEAGDAASAASWQLAGMLPTRR